MESRPTHPGLDLPLGGPQVYSAGSASHTGRFRGTERGTPRSCSDTGRRLRGKEGLGQWWIPACPGSWVWEGRLRAF